MAELQIGIDPSGAKKGSDEAKAALAALADSATNAIKALDGIDGSSKSAGSSLLSLLNPLNLIGAAWNVFTGGASAILGLLNPLNLLNAAVDLVSGAWGLLTSALSMGYSIISGAAQLMANFSITLQFLGSTVLSVASYFVDKLASAIGYTFDKFKEATNVAADFQQSMANVKSMGVESEEAFEGMRAAAIKLGADTSLSSSQAADALYNLRSAGLSSAEAVAALDGAGRLAEATMSPLAMTAETVAATIKQFGMDASQASDISNVFAAAIQNSALTMPRIAEAMKYAGTVAGTLGISLEETTASLMVLNNAGIRGEQSGTVLRSALAKLIDPSKEAADAISSLGLNLDSVNPSVVGIKGVIDALAKSGADTASIMKIFGVEAGPGMAALISAGSSAIDGFQTKITGTNAALEMSKTQLDTYRGALKIFEGSWESLQIVIGDVFLPVLKNVYLGMSEAVNAVTTWVQSTGLATAATTALNGVMAGAKAIIEGFGAAATSVGGVMNTIGTAIAGALTQFGAFATSVGQAVAASASFQAGVQAIVTAAQNLLAPFTTASTAFGSFGSALTATGPSGEVFKGIVSGIADALGAGAKTVADWIASFGPMAAAFAQGVADGSILRDTIRSLSETWQYLVDTAAGASSVLTSAWSLFSAGVSAVSSIVPALSAAVDSMSRYIAFTSEGLAIDWGGLVKVGVDTAIDIIKSIPTVAAEVAAMVGPALAAPLSKLAPDLSAALAANDWAAVWGVITTSVPALVKQASDALVTGAKNLWTQYQGPIKAFLDQLRGAVMTGLDLLNNEIKAKFGIDLGGILKTLGAVQTGVTAFKDAVGGAAAAVGTAYGNMEVAASNALGNIRNEMGAEYADTLSAAMQVAGEDSSYAFGASFNAGIGAWAAAPPAGLDEFEANLFAFEQELAGYGNSAAISYSDAFATTITGQVKSLDDTMRAANGEVFAKYPMEAWDWGSNVADSYAGGFNESFSGSQQDQWDALENWASSIKSNSPPKAGPLKEVDKWGMSVAESFADSFSAFMTGKGTESISASINQMSQTAFGIMDQTMSAITAKAQGNTLEMMSRGGGVASTQGAQAAGSTTTARTSTRTTNSTSNTAISVNLQNMSPAMMAQMLQLEMAKRGR